MRRILRATVCAVALGVAGCAAAPAPTPPPGMRIANANEIAGKWVGTVTITASGKQLPTTVTITKGGRWYATNSQGFSHQGSFYVANGEAHAKSWTTGATGTWVLRKVNGKEVLDTDYTNSQAELRRAR